MVLQRKHLGNHDNFVIVNANFFIFYIAGIGVCLYNLQSMSTLTFLPAARQKGRLSLSGITQFGKAQAWKSVVRNSACTYPFLTSASYLHW